jgi:hypothetical protein
VTSIYERIITDDQVEDAVMETLKKWLSTELRVIEEDLGLVAGHYQRPQSWGVHGDFDKFPEEAMPSVIVISLGAADVGREGNKKIRTAYDIAVAVFASSTDFNKSRLFAYRLSGAAKAVMIHRQSLDGALDGTVRGVNHTGGQNGEMPVDGERTVWASRQTYSVEVANTITMSAGPSAPDSTPPPDPDPSTPPDPLPAWDTIPDRAHIHIANQTWES